MSTSAEEARESGFLDRTDGVSFNQDHLIYDAKQAVLRLADAGYKPSVREKVPVTGESGYAALLLGAQQMHLSGYISDYDLEIAKKIAFVLSGGKVPFGTKVDEQYLLDLEREAFLSLIAQPKTQQRDATHAVKRKTVTGIKATRIGECRSSGRKRFRPNFSHTT
ncbi:Enoyl-CoA hydratase [Heyndrickxia coagulans]|nr:Enoyl-CoA hydratase [Heyndrickxia coagulans]